MAKCVRRDVLRQAGPIDVPSENLPRAHARQWLATRVQKQRAASFPSLEPWAKLAQIYGERADSRPTNGNEPLLCPLAEHTHQGVLHHHVSRTDPDPLGDTQSCTVRKLEQRAVSKIQRIIDRR